MSKLNIIDSIKALIAKHHQKIRQQDFLKAAMAACALLSVADGEVNFAELMARDYVLDHVKQLQLCDPNQAADLFRDYTEALQENYEAEKSKILKLITPYADDAELAPLLLRICLVIAKADEQLKPSEQEIVNQLQQALQIEKLKPDYFL
jgi:tellurite resistance protein